jgi:dihydrofolate reductase
MENCSGLIDIEKLTPKRREQIMSKVFVDIRISLDGFIAGPNGDSKNPLGDDGLEIHEWLFKQKAFLSHLKLEGGDTDNPDYEIIQNIFDRIGANIIEKNMFIEGEANWPAETPLNCPVYVLSHQKREPWERPEGITFYFTDENIEDVLKKVKQAAGKKMFEFPEGQKQFSNILIQV